MKLVINIPDYVKEQADDGKGEELGIPLWLAYEIANGTPLPKGHGRLIDMKMLIKFVTDYCEYDAVQLIRANRTDYLPTIIEADKVESEK